VYNHPINDNVNVLDASIVDVDIDDRFITLLDTFDPRNCDILNVKTRNILIEKGPIGTLNITFHIDKLFRRCLYSFFLGGVRQANATVQHIGDTQEAK